MTPLLQFTDLARVELPGRPLHLAIGIFDGVHLGHRTVIAATIQAARQNGGLAGVLTFSPHPSTLFNPERPTPLLMPPEMKRRVLARLGIDFVIEQNFSREFARVAAGDFVPLLRHHLPKLSGVYVGENWRFGRGRTGDVALLTAEAAKVGLTVLSVPRLAQDGVLISSSRIRDLLAAGAIAEANTLLGYSYFAEGVVESGRRLGQTIGFPTLNIAWRPELKPCYGVYAVEVTTAGGNPLPGVANYGLRPTAGKASEPLLEVHLLEQSTLTYGEKLTVNWLHFLRPESKFGSIEELRRQIAIDVQKAREFFQNYSA